MKKRGAEEAPLFSHGHYASIRAMIIKLIILAGLGLCFGSFVNALTWRIHKKKDWVKERSVCTHCGHQLAAKDLVPVLSWVSLRGKCRYCARRISIQYPVVELAAALVFMASYAFWPVGLGNGQSVLLVTWLVCSIGLLALFIYDARWMLLPNKIIYPTFALAAIGQFIYLVGFAPDKPAFLIGWGLSILAASGLFWSLFVISQGRWIGYGDVRLGLITGTILHSPALSILMIFLASLMGSLAVLPLLLTGKKKLSAKLPYGPVLILAAFICLLFGQSIIDWYKNSFLS
ncbi:MAG: putative Prepilin peptidase [Candidatus Saccharibacteria bacterium]|nr:putative Prepilin peptidase [Candidatus Saccharibacteria bacterium]